MMQERSCREKFMKLFDYDSTFIRTVNLLMDLTLLHLLFLVFSVPLVTVGASLSAQYYAVGRLQLGDRHIVSNFWKSFRKSFKHATIFWILFVCISLLFYVDYHWLTVTDFPFRKPMIVLSFFAFFLLCSIALWFFPVVSHFQGNFFELLTNSFLYSLYIPLTLLSFGLFAATAFLFLKVFILRIFLLICGTAFLSYCNISLFRIAFQKH